MSTPDLSCGLPVTGTSRHFSDKRINQAREAWSDLRYEVCWAHLIPKKTIRELLRLQAKYGRAYTLLQKHVQSCRRCEPLPKTA